MAVSVRNYIDCREFPSESNCSLRISGTESEVLTTAVAHAVAKHGHTDTPEFREQLRGALREERATP
jgi:predicted small metal-binding protein